MSRECSETRGVYVSEGGGTWSRIEMAWLTCPCTSNIWKAKGGGGDHEVEANPDCIPKPCLKVSNTHKTLVFTLPRVTEARKLGGNESYAWLPDTNFPSLDFTRMMLVTSMTANRISSMSLTLLYKGMFTFRYKHPALFPYKPLTLDPAPFSYTTLSLVRKPIGLADTRVFSRLRILHRGKF